MQQECDVEFEEITDGLTRVILTTAILDIDEMLIDKHWQRLPGDGPNWEQALVRHKIELQQGLAGIKERLRRANEEEPIAVDMKKIPSIVVQEPDLEDDRKMIEAFEGDTRSPKQQEVEVGEVPQIPPAASPQSQETPKDSNSSVPSSSLIELTPSPAAESLPPSTPAANTTQEFASIIKDLLEPGTDDEQPNSTRVEIESQIERESKIEVRAVEQSTRSSIIRPNADMADKTSLTHIAAPLIESTERSSTGFASGHKRNSNEAGFDERATSFQIDVAEQDEEVETPPTKRKNVRDSETSEMAPPKLLPKTPAKANTLRAKPNATPASVRRSKRHLDGGKD
jgi:hypothetical protein